MGFGFNLLFVFIIAPLLILSTGSLLVIWLITRKKIFGKIVAFCWLGVFGFFVFTGTFIKLFSQKELQKRDYYGQYVVNRNYFKGEQADWQYNTFRFEIKKNDSIFFYVTDRKKILKTYRGTVSTTSQYRSARLIIDMEPPAHHILSSNPTTYRSTWSFYLVFYSPNFNNVFFKKEKWKSIT